MTSPVNDDTSLCFGFNVGYWVLLDILIQGSQPVVRVPPVVRESIPGGTRVTPIFSQNLECK